jgi:hypothetical protein
MSPELPYKLPYNPPHNPPGTTIRWRLHWSTGGHPQGTGRPMGGAFFVPAMPPHPPGADLLPGNWSTQEVSPPLPGASPARAGPVEPVAASAGVR